MGGKKWSASPEAMARMIDQSELGAMCSRAERMLKKVEPVEVLVECSEASLGRMIAASLQT